MTTPDGCYDDDYYRASLHRRHWFRNNAAKAQRRWDEVLRLLGHNKPPVEEAAE